MKKLALILTIIGGINWGLVGLFNFNLVSFLFGEPNDFNDKIKEYCREYIRQILNNSHEANMADNNIINPIFNIEVKDGKYKISL